MAERATALGFFPDGQCGTIAEKTEGRERMDRLGEIDPASEDVLIEVIRKLEEQLWMIGAQFQTV